MFVLIPLTSCTFVNASDDSDDEDTTTFSAEGVLESNSCGDGALNVEETVALTIELTIEGHDVLFSDGELEAEGVLEDDDVSFEAEQTTTVDLREAGSTLPACSVLRTDTISGALDSASSTSAFDATWRIRYEATDGSDCSDLLEGDSLVFEALPCSVRYDVTASVEE